MISAESQAESHRQQLRYFVSSLTLLLAVIAMPAATFAAPPTQLAKAGDDFGAETIETEEDLKKLALPVDQVEERDGTTQGPTTFRPPVAPTNPGAEVKPEEILGKDSGDTKKLDDTSTTILNVKDADIATLVKTFSRLLKRNYIVDSNVKGKVTIHLAEPVTVAEALKIFDSVLLLKGFTTVPIGGNVYKVIPAKDASQTTIPLVNDGTVDNPSDTLVTQLVRLRYVQAADMQQLLAQFVSKEGVINSFSGTNSLILIDSLANIERLKRLLREIDVPARDQEITVIPIVHAEAKDIAEKVSDILGVKDETESSSTNQAQNIRTRAANMAAQRMQNVPGVPNQPSAVSAKNVEASRALPVKLIPDERTNSIIVVADEDMTLKVRALVEQLDSPLDLSGGKFYVYRLKYAKADELADTLSQLIDGVSQSGSTSSAGVGSRGGSSLTRAGRDAEQSRERQTQTAADRLASALGRRRTAGGGFEGGGEGGKVNFEGEVSIAPDVATNSLIINASRGDYQRVKDLIDALDVKRPQVFVEATILEVSINKNQSLGISLQTSGGTDDSGIIAQNNLGGITDILTNPAGLQDLTIAAASTGTITLPGDIKIPTQAAVLRAASSNDDVNVLSAPTILTTDNQEAEIIVGQNIPFVTNTSTDQTNLQNTFNQIQRQDVGIKLKLTPQISSNDFVTLKIFVEISNVVPGTQSDRNGPTTTIRTTETTVAVKTGQMIVTGGLISDDNTQSRSGVPYLQDIPVLGNLFSATTDTNRRTNLLVFITPRIIKDQFDARENTVERRDQLTTTMEKYGSNPDRAEVLQSSRIDDVAERAAPNVLDIPPSTIMGPKNPTAPEPNAEEQAAIQRTEQRIKALLGTSEASPEQTPAPKEPQAAVDSERAPAAPAAEPEIDLRVAPKLPAPASAAASRTRLADPSDAAVKSYVVLRALGERREELPFTYADDLGTVGIATLGKVDSPGATFFVPGAQYEFRLTKGAKSLQTFVCLGRFASQSEAQALAPSLSRSELWYNLSPQDVLTLGRGQWQAKR